jgi:hypothetical protein
VSDEELLSIGDVIEFNFFGEKKIGSIESIGKHGYWIAQTSGCVGSGFIRCAFKYATKIATH